VAFYTIRHRFEQSCERSFGLDIQAEVVDSGCLLHFKEGVSLKACKLCQLVRSMVIVGILALIIVLMQMEGWLPAPDAVDIDPSGLHGRSAPTPFSVAANRALERQLPFDDQRDFEQAQRGLIATPESLHVVSEPDGATVWDMPQYNFVQGAAPDSVNPSLWRQAQLNTIHGLFEVTPGIYQLRGFDLANMTLIRGESGWIVVDPLTARQTARVAFDFAMQHLANRHQGERRISAVIYTHSHIDHFGGTLGLLDREQLRAGAIPVIAPAGFMEEATSENMIAGTAMSRRAVFMYGKNLRRDAYGHVDSGLGKGPAFGDFGIANPTRLVAQTDTRINVDGVEFVFQFTPESEAPAEFTFYLPKFRAFCGGEIVSRTMHNLYTLRGAKVRDALKWSAYIEEARNLFAEAEIYFGSHHWPIWGQAEIQTFLTQQRDTYKYLHDQTVRYLNRGMTPGAIAETLQLPETLARVFSSRGYYGTVKHNVRAIYQHYLGWYDANPAHLDPLPDVQRAVGYVQLAGGEAALLASAQGAYDQGNYRWAAELLNHLVFANPERMDARELLARSYDQLGYQAESGPWRSVYLTGALELREGTPETGINIATMKDVLEQTPVENFFATLAVRLQAEDAAGKDTRVQIHFSDLNQRYLLWLENSVLHHRAVSTEVASDAVLTLTHPLFIRLLTGEAGLKETLFSDQLSVEGSRLELLNFFSLFEQPVTSFPIVLPE
jgi:alkyl sulfatase BDS1-like metallo-beta-lactamase superfamily hydrolase